MLHKFLNYNKHIFPETHKNIGLSVNNSIHAKTVIYRRYKPTSYKKKIQDYLRSVETSYFPYFYMV